MQLQSLILIGGICHFGILIASALTPGELKWREELANLSPLSRQLIWVHGAFIVLVILGFGLISSFNARQLAEGSRLARALCAFIAMFWGARLMVQLFIVDARPHLRNRFLKIGYHGLTVVFTYLTLAFAAAALRP